jgi:hypothetical protein
MEKLLCKTPETKGAILCLLCPLAFVTSCGQQELPVRVTACDPLALVGGLSFSFLSLSTVTVSSFHLKSPVCPLWGQHSVFWFLHHCMSLWNYSTLSYPCDGGESPVPRVSGLRDASPDVWRMISLAHRVQVHLTEPIPKHMTLLTLCVYVCVCVCMWRGVTVDSRGRVREHLL